MLGEVGRPRRPIVETLCACGCGETLILSARQQWKGVRYLPNHSPRVNSGKGKVLSDRPRVMPGTLCGCGCGAPIPERWPNGAIRYITSKDGKAYLDHHQPLSGENHYRWKGGKTTARGYVILLTDERRPNGRRRYVRENRLVGAEKVGRPLKRNEDAHHLNEVKDDNRPENIQVMTKREHHRLHWTATNPRAGR